MPHDLIDDERMLMQMMAQWQILTVTHICVSDLIIIGSDNGLSPGRRQAIIWTNTGIVLIGPVETNFSEILIEIQIFSFKNMRLNMRNDVYFVSVSMRWSEYEVVMFRRRMVNEFISRRSSSTSIEIF